MASPYIIFLSLYAAHVVIGLSLLASRMKHEPIRSRTPSLLFPSAFYGLLTVLLITLLQEAKDATLLCSLSVWNSIIFVPSWLSPHFLRAFILYNQFRWNQEKMAFSEDILKSYSSLQVQETCPEPRNIRQTESRLKRYRLFTSPLFNFALFVFIFVVNAAVGAALFYGNPAPIPEDALENPAECLGWVLYLVIVHLVLEIVGLLVSSIMLWKVQDGYFIKQEFTVYFFFLSIFVVCFLVIFSVPSLSGKLENPLLFTSIFFLFTFSVYFPFFLSFTKRFTSKARQEESEGSSTETTMDETPNILKMSEASLFKHAMKDEHLYQQLKVPFLLLDSLSLSCSSVLSLFLLSFPPSPFSSSF